MQLSRDTLPDANLITGLDDASLRVRDRILRGSVIVAARTIIENWPVRHAAELEHEHWQPVLELEPEIVLFGSGDRLIFPANAALAPLLTRNIGVEVMDTAAACRTYNLLLAEGRVVVAALILATEDSP